MVAIQCFTVASLTVLLVWLQSGRSRQMSQEINHVSVTACGCTCACTDPTIEGSYAFEVLKDSSEVMAGLEEMEHAKQKNYMRLRGFAGEDISPQCSYIAEWLPRTGKYNCHQFQSAIELGYIVGSCGGCVEDPYFQARF